VVSAMPYPTLNSAILDYIIEHQMKPGDHLPTIPELSRELGVSVSKIREELAVARTLGLVDTRPRVGTQVQPFDFGPAASLSAVYALRLDRAHFHALSQVRASIELSFWHQAVARLTAEDVQVLRAQIAAARLKLLQVPIEVPFEEHRRLHLTFFIHLDNLFVQGILEAYWAAYQAFGLGLYAGLAYHHEVWDYHERMTDCVARGDFDGGHQALRDHMVLLRYRPEELEVLGQGHIDRFVTSHHLPE
jgi:DNA-binding FadR family transcriptional regulator